MDITLGGLRIQDIVTGIFNVISASYILLAVTSQIWTIVQSKRERSDTYQFSSRVDYMLERESSI